MTNTGFVILFQTANTNGQNDLKYTPNQPTPSELPILLSLMSTLIPQSSLVDASQEGHGDNLLGILHGGLFTSMRARLFQ